MREVYIHSSKLRRVWQGARGYGGVPASYNFRAQLSKASLVFMLA